MTLSELRRAAAKGVAEYRLGAARLSEERATLEVARTARTAAEEVRAAFQSVAAGVQKHAHAQITGVVTSALRAVFRDPYQFHIDFVKRRGKTEADLYFSLGGRREDPEDGVGQGLVDVAAFALRLISLRLRRPRPRQVVILDEPMKNVNGAGNRRRCAALVEALAEQLGVQVILVTGYDWLEVGKVLRLPGRQPWIGKPNARHPSRNSKTNNSKLPPSGA